MNELEEKKLMDSIEQDDWKQIDDVVSVKEKFKKAAENTSKKDKRINIRMTGRDVEQLKSIAMEEGLPYQTLISSVLHKYVNGRLIDRKRFENE